MRYLKSAALLLLTASSSVSLLSATANAEKDVQGSDNQDRIDNPLTVDTSMATGPMAIGPVVSESASVSADSTRRSSIMTPLIDEMRSPQFDLLRTRLLSDTAPSWPIAATAENITGLEITNSTGFLRADSQPEKFIQSPPLTLDSLREQITTTQQAQSEGTAASETASETVSEPASTDDAQLAQADTTNSLPELEEAELPATEADAEVTPLEVEQLPEAPPTETEQTETEQTETEQTEAEATPPADSVVEIEGLPDTLFSDPNPLSLPTQESEVDIEQNPVVTIEQAIALAYQNNQTLQASVLALEQAEAGIASARAANRPTVVAGANLNATQNGLLQDSVGISSSTTLGGTVEVEYDVLTGGARTASIRAAELQRDVSALTVEAQQEQIRLATATTYYELQNAGEQIRINQSFLDEAARNLRDAQLRQEVGVGTRFDTLRAEVQFANARQSLIQAQGSQRIARRDISRLLNLPPTTGLTATPVEVADTWPLTLEESILLAFQNRAELEQQLIQSDISEQQRRQALSAVRPQVSVFANYSPQLRLDDSSALNEDFQDSVSFGARFNWQLYDGGAARAQARQQEIGGAIAEEQFSETLDQVRFDVEQAYFNLETNQENILTSQVAVAQATEALSLANLRLQAGVGTQLDVLTAQRELTDAQGNNITAILGYNQALVSIERAISNVATPF